MATAAFGTTILEPGEEVGGGVNHSSKTVQALEEEVEGMGADTQVRNHLSPKGLVGLVRV